MGQTKGLNSVTTLIVSSSPDRDQVSTDFFVSLDIHRNLKVFIPDQLNDCLNSTGDICVFCLNNLLNDCAYSKPSSNAISLTDNRVMESRTFAFPMMHD